jgi:hypothetical protein
MPACPTNALPGDPIEGNLAVRCLSGTQPVDINFESGGNPREDIERRNCNSLAPKLHIALTYVEPPGGASGADASPFQGEPQGCALGYCPHRYAQGARWFERVDSYRWISLRKCLYSRRRLLNELVKFIPALLATPRPNMWIFLNHETLGVLVHGWQGPVLPAKTCLAESRKRAALEI